MSVKRIVQGICLVQLALAAGACGGTPTPTSGGAADLLTERHQVQCRHPGEVDKEVPVGQHEPVGTGDEINTDENGLGILTFSDFLRVEVFRQTGLQVKAAPDPDAPPIVKLYLALGTTLQELQQRAGERVTVTTETDWATIKSVSTKYLVSVDEDEVTSVFVYEGEAEVEAQQQTVTVRAGQATLVEPRQAPRAPMDAEMGAVDDWVSGARQAEEVGSIQSVIFPSGVFVDLGPWSSTVEGSLTHALIEGPDGKIYSGTHAGSARNAHLFSYEPGAGFTDLGEVPPGNADIYVSAITVGSDGRLYVGTSDHAGLVVYDPISQAMAIVGNSVAGGSHINQLLEGPGGKIYGATAFNGRLFAHDPASGEIQDLGQVANGEPALFGLVVSPSGEHIFLTSSSCPYGGTASLYSYNVTTGETTSLGLLVSDARYASYNVVTAPDGKTYDGAGTTTGEGHLWRFEPEHPDTIEDVGAVAVPGESRVDFVAVGGDGKVYATTRPNGHLVVFDPGDPDAGILDLGQPGDVGHIPLVTGPDGRLYLGVGDHLYAYNP